VDLSEVESTSTLKPDKANPPDGVDGEHLLAFSSSTLGVILN
jgi:hypothetical protein